MRNGEGYCSVIGMRIRRVVTNVIELDETESADVQMALVSWLREMLPKDSPTQVQTIETFTRVLDGDAEVAGVEYYDGSRA